jgi:hypothetical protein
VVAAGEQVTAQAPGLDLDLAYFFEQVFHVGACWKRRGECRKSCLFLF